MANATDAELVALLRKSARIILIRLIQSESTIAFGAWLAYQFALQQAVKVDQSN